jgi:hypothetical protein
MNINELNLILKDVALNKVESESFYIGDKWDNSTGKGDLYPAIWVETPYLIDYQLSGNYTKKITFAIDVLMFPKLDDVEDEVNMISHAEEMGDEFLFYLRKYKELSIASATALSVKSFNADQAAGVRIDIVINVGRVCPVDIKPQQIEC